ncbi:hypothetical protein HNQ76_000163 [Thermosulfuriphilus ammonigenes]|uniref:DUF4202 family protein n=1 Tax=Thermosulfuriphilus ammonigenes TaxID=1936021 RepID=UPI0017C9FFC4|nr:DUF4202 family protein [Thermosulfuriphilus ammonigenes]MBA2847817.1 hypothetical protein [Thermosulfuriphilus ammonigenes]
MSSISLKDPPPEVLKCITTRIRELVAQSEVPEDPAHAENTLRWLRRLFPEADPALEIAALGHDLERARPQRLRREEFSTYEAFKEAHANLSAQILEKLMRECGADQELIAEVCRLVRRHEQGGDPRADILKEADSLSFFEVNLPLYAARNSPEETKRRCLWGLRRLSPQGLLLVREIDYPNETLRGLVEDSLRLLEEANS